jgi:type I restriction enzyme R subunit
MSQQEYENYKSRYQTIYDNLKKDRETEKTSILADIDFVIEIIQTDRINVAYIMNLLRNVDLKDPVQKEKDIDNIRKEMARSDSPELKRKVDLIKGFLDEVVPNMKASDDMDNTFQEYENKKRNAEIDTFANEMQLDNSFLKDMISEYEYSGNLDRESIREKIKKPLLIARKIIAKITDFVVANCNKYKWE